MNQSPYLPPESAKTAAQPSVLQTNKVLRNTYMLLAITLAFSALTAALSMIVNPPPMTSLICSVVAIVILWFVVPRTANSSYGLLAVFAFTGLLGFGLGPMLNAYLTLSNGPQYIMMALGGTGAIFVAMSGIAIVSKRDFSFMRGFLAAGLMVAFIVAIAGLIFNMPMIMLVVSAAFLLLSSGLILWQTSEIIRGGETNYILATTTLYVSIYNIFVSLLHLISAFDE